MRKRVGNIEVDTEGLKWSPVTIRVHYNFDVSEKVRLAGYDQLCDLEYQIKTLKRKMEE